MTEVRDIERLLDAWLGDDGALLPDRVLDASLAQIDTTPQRRVLIRVPWRIPTMNSYAKMALTAVVAVVVAVGGIALLRPGQSSGPGAAPSAASSATPSVAPSPSTARLASVGQVGPPPASISVTVPPGWGRSYEWAVGKLGGIDEEPFVGVWQIDNRFKDPCTDHALLSPAPGPGVDELLDALASQPGITAGPITDVTIDGYSGKYVELTMAIEPLTCGPEDDGFWLWASPAGGLFGHYSMVGGIASTTRVYALDIAGTRYTFFARIPSGTSAEDRATLETIIDSIEIEPGSAALPSP